MSAPAAAGYPYVPLDAEGVKAQVDIPSSPEELHACMCKSRLQ